LNLIQGALLGLVQGLTEFLPVSSSGHLVILQKLTGFDNETSSFIFFDTLLHLGTLFAILLIFRYDIKKIVSSLINWNKVDEENRVYRRISGYLAIGSIPIAVLGYSLSGIFEELFRSILVVGLMLIVTGAILLVADRFSAGDRPHNNYSKIRLSDSIWVGVAQAMALIPGISRSGITITAGLVRGMDRKTAASFSFLFSIPAIIGASIYSFLRIGSNANIDIALLLVGIFVAFISGIIAIKVLLYIMEKKRLRLFSVYCFALGTLTLTLNFI